MYQAGSQCIYKHALIRYRVINRWLIDRKYVSKTELKEACERALDISPIGLRTIDGDIHAMRYDRALGYQAPIRIDRSSSRYYYDDPNYSIDNIPLDEEELGSLLLHPGCLISSGMWPYSEHLPDRSVSSPRL
ncbi:MAG: hypothetical protein ACFCUM_03255 [Bacteroidales bacterium]